MALRLIAATKTDSGLQREQNEDACHAQVLDDCATGLFIVADGMGGYHAGEIASRLAVETIRDELQPLVAPRTSQPTVRLNKRKRGRQSAAQEADHTHAADAAETTGSESVTSESAEAASDEGKGQAEQPPASAGLTRTLDESVAMEHYGDRLRAAVESSSEVIVRYGKEHSDARGLGSTVTAALVVEGQAYIANVGDSRTYLMRDGVLQRITRDHSLVARLVEAGQIDADDVYDHPNRNLIYRSLGAGKAEVEVDIFTETLQAGDALLLCSDGLWEMVRDPDISTILTETTDPAEACELLIQRANDNGGEDNITAVLVRCEEG